MYTKPGTQSDSVISETESHHTNTANGSATCQSDRQAPVEGEYMNMHDCTHNYNKSHY